MQKSLFLGVREGILIKLFIKATIPMVSLHVVYALFGSLALLKIIPLVAGILSTFFFFFNSYHALKLNHRDQTEVSSEGLFKNPYTFTYFRHNLEPKAFWYRSCAREGPGKICSRDSTNSGYFSNLALLRLR